MKQQAKERIYKSIIFFGILFGIDRLSKFLILNGLSNCAITSFLSFDVTMNRGIAWGLFHSEGTIGFLAISGIILIIIGVMLGYAWRQLCIGRLANQEVLVLAGATSNLADRLIYSGVIDFIHFHVASFSFPVFNLADVFIVVGVGLILFTNYEK